MLTSEHRELSRSTPSAACVGNVATYIGTKTHTFLDVIRLLSPTTFSYSFTYQSLRGRTMAPLMDSAPKDLVLTYPAVRIGRKFP